MKAVITGANGIVGKEMVKYLKKINVNVVEWDRNKVSPHNYNEMRIFLENEKPDILFHFAIASHGTGIDNETWKVNYEWTSELAWITKELGIKFLFTSTAMVFTDYAKGPFTINSIPDAKEGYGYEKLKAEERAIYQNKNTYIARLGWQIGDEFEGNNMLAYCENEYKKNGIVSASGKWYPACSFVCDTVAELFRIVTDEKPGIYMIDSNDRYTFYEVVSILNYIYKNRWKVEENSNFIFEQRMIDMRTKMPKFSSVFENYKPAFDENYYDGNTFHNNKSKIYTSGEDIHFKSGKHMAKVFYNPAHLNKKYDDERRGERKTFVKWIYSEQEETAENFISDNLSMVHDTYLEPFGSIGEHMHDKDDEIYYIINGEIEVFVTDINGNVLRKILCKGDGHAVKKGEKHFIKAGKEGSRFIVIGIK